MAPTIIGAIILQRRGHSIASEGIAATRIETWVRRCGWSEGGAISSDSYELKDFRMSEEQC
jgi:hypothetical protein